MVYFQIRPCIVKHLIFLNCVRLGCNHSLNYVCWKLVTGNLTFYKTRQLATWLQVSSKFQVQTGFQAYSSKKTWDLFCLLNFSYYSSNYFKLGLLHQNGRPRDWDFNHTRLRSRTCSSGIFPIQCQFSKLRQSYAPFWQEVITVIVA